MNYDISPKMSALLIALGRDYADSPMWQVVLVRMSRKDGSKYWSPAMLDKTSVKRGNRAASLVRWRGKQAREDRRSRVDVVFPSSNGRLKVMRVYHVLHSRVIRPDLNKLQNGV